MNDNLDVTLQDKLQAVDIFMAPGSLLSAVHSLYDTHAAAERHLRDTQFLANLRFLESTTMGVQPFYMDPKKLEKFYILLKEIGAALKKYEEAKKTEEA